MKKCPYCAEEIQDDAIKCRFCGEFLKKRWWKNCLVGCLITFIVSIISIFIFFNLSFLFFKFIIHRIFFSPQKIPHDFYYSPFPGQGLENIFKDFGEFFRDLWGKLMDLLRIGSGTHSV